MTAALVRLSDDALLEALQRQTFRFFWEGAEKASLLARDNLVSTVKGLTTKYRTRASLERELKRYERRGATARNRFERQVRRTRAKFERELRQRRTTVERSVKQNRRQFERQVKSVRKDFEKQSGVVTARVDKLVSDAQGLIS